jgi:hypothetical protein
VLPDLKSRKGKGIRAFGYLFSHGVGQTLEFGMVARGNGGESRTCTIHIHVHINENDPIFG